MATTAPVPRGITAKNRKHLASLYMRINGPFSVQEASEALSFPTTRTQRFLAYLAERGWLARVHRGLYAPVPLDAINPGEWQVDTWIVAAKLLGPDHYIGGWTACEHWGLTEQIFLETVLVTTRKMRSKHITIQGFPFLVKRAPEKKMFGTKTICRDQTKVNISDPSRTILDVLEDPSMGGGIHHVVDVMDTYFRAEHRDDELLAAYVGQAGNRVVFKRLGYILEELEVDAPALLQACEAGVSSGVSRLDPSLPNQGPVVWRWNLRLNGRVQSNRASTNESCLAPVHLARSRGAAVAND